MKGNKCTCGPANLLWLIVAAIIMGAGAWLFVSGIQAQWEGTLQWQVLLFKYAAGLLVWHIGKIFKMKSMCSACCA